jgi:lysozyme
MVDISARGIRFIKDFEGAKTLLPDGRYKSYLDTLAYPPVWTVFTGLTRGVTKDTCWTLEECEERFRKEVTIYEDAIDRLVTVPLNQNQADALISYVYNCGPGALAKSTLLKVLNQGKYEQVPAQLMRWTKAGGKEWPGLVRRRKAEGALFMEPVDEDHMIVEKEGDVPVLPPMPQRVEEKPVVPVGEVVAKSWTIRSALAAIGGAIIQGYNWLTETAIEAGKEAGSVKTALGPFDALFASLKANVGLLATIAIIVGCAVVISRRISDAKEGMR